VSASRRAPGSRSRSRRRASATSSPSPGAHEGTRSCPRTHPTIQHPGTGTCQRVPLVVVATCAFTPRDKPSGTGRSCVQSRVNATSTGAVLAPSGRSHPTIPSRVLDRPDTGIHSVDGRPRTTGGSTSKAVSRNTSDHRIRPRPFGELGSATTSAASVVGSAAAIGSGTINRAWT
jgi:hypothetical protein